MTTTGSFRRGLRRLALAGGSALLLIGVAAAPASAVINGKPVTDDSAFPFAVELSYAVDGGHAQCTGSLVAANWVLTAGHCVPGDPETPVSLRIGSISTDSGGTLRPADYWTVYPGFDGDKSGRGLTASGDMALFHFADAVDNPTVALVPVDSDAAIRSFDWPDPTVIGYGQIDFVGTSSAELRHTKVNEYSENSSGKVLTVTSRFTGHRNQGDYEGDSGGPLLVWDQGHWVQTGVFSTYELNLIPSLRVRTALAKNNFVSLQYGAHRDWINETIAEFV